MSLQTILGTAVSGLSTAQRALAVTSNNVANANTDGYTRKIHNQAAVALAGQSAGVRAEDPTRIVDAYLERELRTQTTQLGRSDALADYQDRIQGSILGEPGDTARGLGNGMTTLANAAEALANTPGSSELKAGFLGAAQDLLHELSGDAAAVQSLRQDADGEVKTAVDQINADIKSLAAINAQLSRQGSSPELADQRDQILGHLARNLDITAYEDQNGAVTIYTKSGSALLDGTPSQLVYKPASTVAASGSFGPITLYHAADLDPATGSPLPSAKGTVLVTAGVRADLTPELAADGTPDGQQVIRSSLGSGRLQGLLEVRDRVLPQLADQLAELGAATAYALNKAHNDAVPLPLPQTLSGTRASYAGYDPAANNGTAHLAVIDKASGSSLAVIDIDVTAASPAAIAAQVSAGLGGLGTASIGADGKLSITLTSSAQGLAIDEGDSRIHVDDAAGHDRDYGFAHYFGLNDLVVSAGATAAELALRPDIAADSSLLSQAAMQVEPGPPAAARVGGAGDGRPAQALAAALQTAVGTVARGGLPAKLLSPSAYATSLIANAAVAGDRAKSTQASDQALVDDLGSRAKDVSGVNLDEELSKLVTYQQAYTASAKIVSITDQLFDILMNMKR